MPSGATPDYLQARIWLHADGSLHTVDRLKERLTNKDHEHQLMDQGFTPRWLGPYTHPENLLARCSPWWMTNPVDLHLLDPLKDGTYHQINNFAEAGGVKLWSDSGGWAIKNGTRDGIDAHRVIEAFNAYAHRGMALDIPPRRDWDTTRFFLSGLARAQARKSRIMLAGKRKDLELVNILHGNRLEHLRLWADLVNQGGFVGWATALDTDLPDEVVGIGGIAPIRGAALLLHEYENQDGVMHLFGMSGQAMIPVAAWMGKFFPNLTSDSTTWMPKTCSYMVNRDGKLTSIKFGRDFRGDEASHLPCRCEFCRLIGTFGKMQEDGAKAVRPLVASHNIVTILAVVEYWNEAARTLSFEDYRAALKERVVRSEETLKLLDYADFAMREGPAMADQEFDPSSAKFTLGGLDSTK